MKTDDKLVASILNSRNIVCFTHNKYVENFLLFFTRCYYQMIVMPLTCIKYWWQEQTRGYSDLHQWNVHSFLSMKAVPALTALKKRAMGTCIKLHREDRFGKIIQLDQKKEYKDVSYNDVPFFTMDEWHAILDDIIYAFQYELDKERSDFEVKYKVYPADYDIVADTHFERLSGGSYEMKKRSNTQPDYTYTEQCDKRQARGLQLFAIYFHNLWD